MRRSQLNKERLDALMKVLVAEGILTEDERELLNRNRRQSEAKELGDGLRERREGSE